MVTYVIMLMQTYGIIESWLPASALGMEARRAGERPDMSPMLFARTISKGEPIKVFNNGDMIRDFTYIDDIAEFMKWYKSDKNPLR